MQVQQLEGRREGIHYLLRLARGQGRINRPTLLKRLVHRDLGRDHFHLDLRVRRRRDPLQLDLEIVIDTLSQKRKSESRSRMPIRFLYLLNTRHRVHRAEFKVWTRQLLRLRSRLRPPSRLVMHLPRIRRPPRTPISTPSRLRPRPRPR